MEKYNVYGKPGCGFCTRAKRLLDRMNLDYNYIDIDEDSQARFFVKEVIGTKKVPQIFKGTDYIGGYTELAAYLEDNQ